jgi:hypothetical protein
LHLPVQAPPRQTKGHTAVDHCALLPHVSSVSAVHRVVPGVQTPRHSWFAQM